MRAGVRHRTDDVWRSGINVACHALKRPRKRYREWNVMNMTLSLAPLISLIAGILIPDSAAVAELHRRHLSDPHRAARTVRCRKFPFEVTARRTLIDWPSRAREVDEHVHGADVTIAVRSSAHSTAAAGLLGIGLVSLLAAVRSLPPGSDYPEDGIDRAERVRNKPVWGAKWPRQRRSIREPPASGYFRSASTASCCAWKWRKRRQRTLDVQYFLIQSDDTGQLLIEALLKAADRGVRVRVLLDDAGSFGRDAQIRTLAGYPNVELRLFNPFEYRGKRRVHACRRVPWRCSQAQLPDA